MFLPSFPGNGGSRKQLLAVKGSSRLPRQWWESQEFACSEFGWQSLAANLERDSLVSPHPEQRSFPLHRVVLEKESLTWVACPGIS